jgi:hypothetical protein
MIWASRFAHKKNTPLACFFCGLRRAIRGSLFAHTCAVAARRLGTASLRSPPLLSLSQNALNYNFWMLSLNFVWLIASSTQIFTISPFVPFVALI